MMSTESEFATLRERMVTEQLAHPRDGRPPVVDKRVLQAMRKVARHLFVPQNMQGSAYQDRPLPIGYGQTISQPYIVGYMTELLELESDHRVLEIGSGCGYQTAVLAELVAAVFSIEIVEPLARAAERTLHVIGYDNITVRAGDGYSGWPEHAPFDRIIVTAAPDHVPAPLLEQLKADGRLVLPVGRQGWSQQLVVVCKDADGAPTAEEVMAVGFVPLVREGKPRSNV